MNTQPAKENPVAEPTVHPNEALRAAFDPSQIGKRPTVTCGACRQSNDKNCDKHSKKECPVCKNWLTTAHMHLDFVGHAHVTDRFLSVDPDWSWDPMALDEDGLPKYDKFGGLWITLTINGRTKRGYGDAPGKNGAVKEIIGDALRNAGMRFGVALELWARGDLAPGVNDAKPNTPAPEPEAAPEPSGRDWIADAAQLDNEDALLALGNECHAFGEFVGPVKKALLARRQALTSKGAATNGAPAAA